MDWNEIFKRRLAPLCEKLIRIGHPGGVVEGHNRGEDYPGYASFCLAGWEWSVTTPDSSEVFCFTIGIGGVGIANPTTLDVRSWREEDTSEGFKASIPLSTDVDDQVHETMRQISAAILHWRS